MDKLHLVIVRCNLDDLPIRMFLDIESADLFREELEAHISAGSFIAKDMLMESASILGLPDVSEVISVDIVTFDKIGNDNKWQLSLDTD